MYKKLGYKEIDLVEVGPRFEMKLYQIRLGKETCTHTYISMYI